jgi:hypothetical protein
VLSDPYSKGEKVTAQAHGGPIDIQGVTVAQVNDALQVQSLETWFDPLEMFRQIAPNGIVNKEIRKPAPEKDILSELTDPKIEATSSDENAPKDVKPESATAPGCPFLANTGLTNSETPQSHPQPKDHSAAADGDGTDEIAGTPADDVEKDMVTASGAPLEVKVAAEEKAELAPGSAVAAPIGSEETKATHEEMTTIKAEELPSLLNKE